MSEEAKTEERKGEAPRAGVEEDNVDAPMIAVLGFIAAILAFVVIVGLQALFYRMEKAEREVKYVNQTPAGLSKLQASQRALLAEYGYVDQAKGVVRIPIEEAMALVTKEYEAAGKNSGNSP